MFAKELYRRLPYFIRRTLTQRQVLLIVQLSAVSTVVIMLVRIFFTFSEFSQRELHLTSNKPNMRTNFGKPKTNFIVGVPSNRLQFYVSSSQGEFICIQSGRKIAFERVNDDFCDCEEDGSDEPSTNACPNSKFYCDNDSSIPSSRVNDGICDCCDGSDEFQRKQIIKGLSEDEQIRLQRFVSPCSNRCE